MKTGLVKSFFSEPASFLRNTGSWKLKLRSNSLKGFERNAKEISDISEEHSSDVHAISPPPGPVKQTTSLSSATNSEGVSACSWIIEWVWARKKSSADGHGRALWIANCVLFRGPQLLRYTIKPWSKTLVQIQVAISPLQTRVHIPLGSRC